jgi:hypothetical protein
MGAFAWLPGRARAEHEERLATFWTGFFSGFASCLALVIIDRLYAGYRIERKARADFLGSLSEYEQKQFLSIETMCNWQQARRMIEIGRANQIEEDKRLVEMGLKKGK